MSLNHPWLQSWRLCWKHYWRNITTYNTNPHALETAELARWLWPGNANLDWDGRVVVSQVSADETASASAAAEAPTPTWREFQPFERFDCCGHALRQVAQLRLLPALSYELELQLNKIKNEPLELVGEYHWAKKFVGLAARQDRWSLDFFLRLAANTPPEEEVRTLQGNYAGLTVQETPAELNTLIGVLMKCFQALPEACRKVMVMRHNLMKSEADIAMATGLDLEGVQRQLADGAGLFCNLVRKRLGPFRSNGASPLYVLGYLHEVRRRFHERQHFIRVAGRVLRRRLAPFPTLHNLLVDCLELLRMEQAQVLVWCFVFGRPIDEIESRLGLDPGQVDTLKRRGLANLKEALEEHPRSASAREQLVAALLRLARAFPLESQTSTSAEELEEDFLAEHPAPPKPDKELGADESAS